MTVTNLGPLNPDRARPGARDHDAGLEPDRFVNLNSGSPTFVDQFGAARRMRQVTFTIPSGADRLVAFDAWTGRDARVGMTLIDPNGNFAAYTRPQGDGNHGEVDVADPVGGKWTAIIFLRDGTLTNPGTVNWQFTTQDFGAADSVVPASQTIAPGQTKTFTYNATLPSSGGDTNRDLVVSRHERHDDRAGDAAVAGHGRQAETFSGNLIGGNGRNGFFQPGQIDTYDIHGPER